MKLYNRHATVESVETPGLKRDVEIRRTAMLDLTPPEINRVVDTLKVAIGRTNIFLKTTNIFAASGGAVVGRGAAVHLHLRHPEILQQLCPHQPRGQVGGECGDS